MPTLSREDELNARLDLLRGWGTLTCRKLWLQVDVDSVRDSFLAVHPALVEVHRVQVAEALEATDRYMFVKAADDGIRYDADWRADQSGRPLVTASGRSANEYIAKTPLVVLNRLKRGYKPSRAMLTGYNYLGRLFGTEAHATSRVAMFARFQAGLADQQVA